MVPSQTRIIFAGITGQQLWDEGFGFWDNVYGMSLVPSPRTTADNTTGFDMSAMRPTRCQDGLIEIVNAKEICTTETIVTVRKDPAMLRRFTDISPSNRISIRTPLLSSPLTSTQTLSCSLCRLTTKSPASSEHSSPGSTPFSRTTPRREARLSRHRNARPSSSPILRMNKLSRPRRTRRDRRMSASRPVRGASRPIGSRLSSCSSSRSRSRKASPDAATLHCVSNPCLSRSTHQRYLQLHQGP